MLKSLMTKAMGDLSVGLASAKGIPVWVLVSALTLPSGVLTGFGGYTMKEMRQEFVGEQKAMRKELVSALQIEISKREDLQKQVNDLRVSVMENRAYHKNVISEVSTIRRLLEANALTLHRRDRDG